MKRTLVIMAILALGIVSVNAQEKKMKKEMMQKEDVMKDVKILTLEQTPGEFTQKNLTVDEGTYTFEIKNSGVDHEVGFVLVRKGDDISKPENHIQTAYVTAPVVDGKTQKSKPTKLEKGEYVYFCPLNPTATDNVLTVK